MCNENELEKCRLEIARLNTELEKAQEEAVRDHMTGLYNRRKFDTELRNFASRCIKPNDNLSLILIDIDNFKSINDNLGHPAGDTVIRAVAKTVIRHTRDCDLSVRYGGEEFAIIINGSFDNAFKIANRIRLDVEKTDINRLLNLNGPQVKITVSGGISGYQSADDTQKAIDLLTQKADDALYKAKHQGKNVVIKSY
jgi:diguanylate cyclase (GGDEF)-like protein